MTNELPPKLYKYQPYTTWSLDNLKNLRLWFSKPSKLNDPFDCATDYDVAELSEDNWSLIYEAYRKRVSTDDEFDSKYINDGSPNELLRRKILSTTSKLFDERKEVMLNNRGVACFSEKFDNLLMWSHYSEGHQGFCLEFDTSYDPFRSRPKIFPVSYSDSIPVLNTIKIWVYEDLELLLEMITIKSSHWSYEKEWRIFHKEGGHEYGVEPAALTGVFFGCSMPYVHKEIISLILRDSPTCLYEMEKEEGKFNLLSQQVQYTPYDYNS